MSDEKELSDLADADWKRSIDAVAINKSKTINQRKPEPTKIMAGAALVQKVYGQKLAAYLMGVTDPRTVGRWARGRESPHAYHLTYLITLYDITNILLMRMDEKAACQWMVTPCDYLDYRLPCDELHVDADFVRTAATRLLVS